MKDKLEKAILKVDLLGQPVSLRINKEKTAKTFIGGVLTIFLLASLTTAFILFSLDAIYKTNPSANIETQILERRANVTLNKNNLPIAFGLTDDGSGLIEEGTYFKFRARMIYNKNVANFTPIETEHKLKKCEAEDFPQLSKEVFDGISLNQMHCFENQNFTISGYWNEFDIQYMIISVHMCSGTTDSGEKCSERETILEKIRSKEMYFNIFMVDSAIILQNYTNPVYKFVIIKFEALSSESFTTTELFVKQQQLHTDDSLLFANDLRNNSIAFDYAASTSVPIGEKETIAEFQIVPSNLFIIHHRTYKKLPQSLAEVGGLSSVFFFGLKIACYLFTSIKQEEQILERIFEFDINDPKNELVTQRTKFVFDENMLANIRHQKTKIGIKRNKADSGDMSNFKYKSKGEINENDENNNNENSNNENNSKENENSNNENNYNDGVSSSRDSNSSRNSSHHRSIIKNDEIDLKNKSKCEQTNSFIKKRKSMIFLFDGKVARKKSTYNLPTQDIKSSTTLSRLTKIDPNSEKREFNANTPNTNEFLKNFTIKSNEKANENEKVNTKENKNLNDSHNEKKDYSKVPTIINQEGPEDDINISMDKNDKESHEVIKDILSEKEKNNKLRFSFCEILRYYICPCNRGKKLTKKFLLYDKSISVLEEFIDIRFIVEKLNEFEKLKFIVLSNEQVALFNLISKEIRSLDDEKSKSNKFNKAKKELNDPDKNAKIMSEFLEELSSKESDNEINVIDKKLFSLLYDQVEKNLDEKRKIANSKL